MSDRPVDILLSAFTGLLSLAPEPHQEAVLRRAITLTMATEEPAPSRPLDSRSRPLDSDRWSELRIQIRSIMELRKIGFAVLASETQMSRSSLEHVLAPSGQAPGELIAGKLSSWLAAQNAESETERDHDSEPEPEPIVIKPAPKLIAVNGHTPPARLTMEQRERLAGHVSMDEQSIRRDLGMTSELLGRAVAGVEVPGEVIERIVRYLAAATA